LRQVMPLLAILTASCSPMTGFGGTDRSATETSTEVLGHVDFCDAARPIYWSRHDTLGTAKAVKEHNAVGAELCNWGTNGAKASQ
jgi:hypothetical protein